MEIKDFLSLIGDDYLCGSTDNHLTELINRFEYYAEEYGFNLNKKKDLKECFEKFSKRILCFSEIDDIEVSEFMRGAKI